MGTDVGGIVDAVPKEAGFLVPAERTADICGRAGRRLQNPERYARMREAARNVAFEQSWDRAAREFLAAHERTSEPQLAFELEALSEPVGTICARLVVHSCPAS